MVGDSIVKKIPRESVAFTKCTEILLWNNQKSMTDFSFHFISSLIYVCFSEETTVVLYSMFFLLKLASWILVLDRSLFSPRKFIFVEFATLLTVCLFWVMTEFLTAYNQCQDLYLITFSLCWIPLKPVWFILSKCRIRMRFTMFNISITHKKSPCLQISVPLNVCIILNIPSHSSVQEFLSFFFFPVTFIHGT